MKHPLFQRNTSIDEKRIGFIETVVSRLALRANKRAIALVTPYPISNAVFGDNIKGSVLRYMFPCEGTITKGLIRLGAKSKQGIRLIIRMFDTMGGTSKEFIIDAKVFLSALDIPVKSGDCLDVLVEPVDPNEQITEVWVSFLWTPTVRDIEAKSFLISELENDLIEEYKSLTE